MSGGLDPDKDGSQGSPMQVRSTIVCGDEGMVVNHVMTNMQLSLTSAVPGADEVKLPLLPLMWVCSNFRAVAAARFHQVNMVAVNGEELATTLAPYRAWGFQQKFYESAHHLAQEVRIALDKRGVLTGKALEILSHAPWDGPAFRQARKLKFTFFTTRLQELQLDGYRREMEEASGGSCYLPLHIDQWSGPITRKWQKRGSVDDSVAMANISAFVQRIKEMTPMLREIEVVSGCPSADWTLDYRHVHSLVTRLFQLVPRIVHTAHGGYRSPELQLGSIANLTHIDFKDRGIDFIAQVAQQNAQTLQSLCIATDVGDISLLIKTGSGDYVEYAQLQVLKLNHLSREHIYEWPTFPGAVPFPKLRLLSVTKYYPFGDDVVFRGNSATLEYLSLIIGRMTSVIIRDCGVFTPSSHPKLKCVKIFAKGNLYPTYFNTRTAYMRFLLNIAPNAAVRTFSGLTSMPTLSNTLLVFEGYANIQVLGLPDFRLQLWEAVTIIHSLPLLSDLHSQLPVLGRLPDNVTRNELPMYVAVKYKSMGERFRCWHVEGKNTAVIDDIAT
ncbi:hypothetical protein GGI19_005102, partial [Coemansia pectinata]